jgi:(+)-neomenthol dehydrogenase
MDTNYHGAKAVTKALLPLFRPSAHGARIVNIGSIFGKLEVRVSKEALSTIRAFTIMDLLMISNIYLKEKRMD